MSKHLRCQIKIEQKVVFMKNVLGKPLEICCKKPLTGYFRDGLCRTDQSDRGTHIVCSVMTEEFLSFSKSKGNDLSTPRPEYNFSGLKEGDCWCLCALRWKEALENNMAPPVRLSSTSSEMLNYVTLEELKRHSGN